MLKPSRSSWDVTAKLSGGNGFLTTCLCPWQVLNSMRNVFHPAFNLDADDAIETVKKFERHLKATGKGVQGLRKMFGSLRQARMDLAKYQRLLSYCLLSLITSTPLASSSSPSTVHEEEEEDTSRAGLLNSEGAWCWREHCDECLRLTKAMQKTVEALQSVANLQEDNLGTRGIERCSASVCAVYSHHRDSPGHLISI